MNVFRACAASRSQELCKRCRTVKPQRNSSWKLFTMTRNWEGWFFCASGSGTAMGNRRHGSGPLTTRSLNRIFSRIGAPVSEFSQSVRSVFPGLIPLGGAFLLRFLKGAVSCVGEKIRGAIENGLPAAVLLRGSRSHFHKSADDFESGHAFAGKSIGCCLQAFDAFSFRQGGLCHVSCHRDVEGRGQRDSGRFICLVSPVSIRPRLIPAEVALRGSAGSVEHAAVVQTEPYALAEAVL